MDCEKDLRSQGPYNQMVHMVFFVASGDKYKQEMACKLSIQSNFPTNVCLTNPVSEKVTNLVKFNQDQCNGLESVSHPNILYAPTFCETTAFLAHKDQQFTFQKSKSKGGR